MSTSLVNRMLDGTAKVADLLQAPFALATRIYVAWVFLKSGWLKIKDWEQTVALFEIEYQVPLLSPYAAAIAGTAGELIFSALLIVGLGGRLPAIGLFLVNIVAVISLWHVFSQDAGVAGLLQHQLWGFMLAMLVVYGSGPWTLDRVLGRMKD
jgi:putative oxidoreductase